MKTDSRSISDVLAKNATAFFIPPFQRAYAWGNTEIDRYFSDVIHIIRSELNASEKDKREHFFGTIVLQDKKEGGFGNISIVVDGQQRLTTTLLFLIALRDIEKDTTLKNKITNRYLKNDDSDFEDKIKLKQVTKDWDAYKALVNGQMSDVGAVRTAYRAFTTLINDTKTTEPDITTEHYILAIQRMNVAVIFLDERSYKGEDPQIIFETLNSLGKVLTLADLVRNYILLSLDNKKQSDLYEKRWQPQIEAQLNEKTSDFYRDYLQYKLVTPIKVVSDNNTKEIYRIFKEYVDKEFPQREDFVSNIICFVPWYMWIITETVTDTISSDSKKDKEIKELLRNIFHDIKANSFKSFVLGLLEYNRRGADGTKLSDDALIEILKTIRTYLIRRRVVGLTSGENLNMVKLSTEIKKLANSKTTMLKLLSGMFYKLRTPNDDEVTERLETINFYRGLKQYSKFILGKIEEHNAKVPVPFRNAKVTIEHIMPQTLSRSWKNELGADYQAIHNAFLDNIGNLILTEFNGEMGNKSFAEKKIKLDDSSLYYRRDILNKDTWNDKSIIKHRNRMISLFLETFSLPEDYKHSDNWNAKKIDKVGFSPLDDEAGEIGEGSKPVSIRIDSERIEVKSWQDAFIAFLNWIKNSDKYDYDSLLTNQEKLFGKNNIIIKRKTLTSLPGDDTETDTDANSRLSKQYKTFEGNFYDPKITSEDDLEFIHIHASTKVFLERIANVMNQFGMPDDFVEIVLKP